MLTMYAERGRSYVFTAGKSKHGREMSSLRSRQTNTICKLIHNEDDGRTVLITQVFFLEILEILGWIFGGERGKGEV
jgi:hypothetical protein